MLYHINLVPMPSYISRDSANNKGSHGIRIFEGIRGIKMF